MFGYIKRNWKTLLKIYYGIQLIGLCGYLMAFGFVIPGPELLSNSLVMKENYMMQEGHPSIFGEQPMFSKRNIAQAEEEEEKEDKKSSNNDDDDVPDWVEEGLACADDNKVSVKCHKRTSGLTLLLLAIFVGGLGVDRCVAGFCCCGFVKAFTFGGCLIWAIVDIVLIASAAESYCRLGPDSAYEGCAFKAI